MKGNGGVGKKICDFVEGLTRALCRGAVDVVDGKSFLSNECTKFLELFVAAWEQFTVEVAPARTQLIRFGVTQKMKDHNWLFFKVKASMCL